MEELIDNRLQADDAAGDELERIEHELQAQRHAYRPAVAAAPVARGVPQNNNNQDDSSSSSDSSSSVGDGGLPAPDPVVPPQAPAPPGDAVVDEGHCHSPEYAAMIAELGLPPPGSICFSCDYDNPESGAICFEHVRRMERLMQSKLSFARTIRLARSLGIFYESYIRKPANARLLPGEQPIPAWHPAIIFQHIRGHVCDTGLRRQGHLNQIQTDIEQYRDNCVYKWAVVDGQRVRVPDERKWVFFEKMVRLYTHVSGVDPRKGGFSWSGVGTPSDETLPLANKKRAYVQNAARFNGSSHAARAAAGMGGSTVQGAGAASKRSKALY